MRRQHVQHGLLMALPSLALVTSQNVWDVDLVVLARKLQGFGFLHSASLPSLLPFSLLSRWKDGIHWLHPDRSVLLIQPDFEISQSVLTRLLRMMMRTPQPPGTPGLGTFFHPWIRTGWQGPPRVPAPAQTLSVQVCLSVSMEY